MCSPLIETLQQRIIWARLYGRPEPPAMAEYEIEPDGRKRKKAVRLALEAGYIGPPQVKTRGRLSETVHAVTEKAYAELAAEPVAPDALRERADPIGIVGLHRFSDGELKWLLEHPESYDWYVSFDTYGREPSQLDGPMAFPDAQARYRDRRRANRTGRVELGVSTPGLREQALEVLRQRKLNEWEQQNLAWGLQTLGIIDRAVQVGKDPETLERDLERALGNARRSLEQARQRIRDLQEVAEGIASYGGFEKFARDYRALIIEEMQRQKAI